MVSRNSRSGRAASRTTRSPQSARSVRNARASSERDGSRFSQTPAQGQGAFPGQGSSGYRPAAPASSRYSRSSGAYGKQTGRTASSNPYSRSNPNYSHKAKKKMGRGAKAAIGVAAALVVVLVGCGTAAAMFLNSVNSDLAGGKTDEEILAIQEKLVPTTTFDEPFYMMLIGSDRRADDESMGARSDTNIVVRVDPTQNLVTMVSIPRDTRIDIDGYGINKFNAIYNYSGAAGVIEEASQLCDIDISHYAEVNFEELIALVDAVGGVEVEVPETIDDPDAGDIVIEAGLQHLDGEAALVFARSRAYADGDFTRTSNQRLLIQALAEKVLSLPATDLPGVIQQAAKCVTTDLTVNDIFSLATQFQDAGNLTVYSAMVPSYTQDIDGISYVIADQQGLAAMMEIVDEGGDPNTVQLSGYAAIGSSLYSDSSSTSGTGTSSGSGSGSSAGSGSVSGSGSSYY